MDLSGRYNPKSPAVKRLMREASEMHEPTEDYSASPINDNLFEWHFTIRGAVDSDFEGGMYHGRITFPSEYPMKPPNILLLTPNGRFEINKKICLSISGHHPETWQPSWCVRTALVALIAFMPTPGNGTVGSLDYTKEERQLLAKKSKTWECNECGKISNLLLSQSESSTGIRLNSEIGKTNEESNEPPNIPACSEHTHILSTETETSFNELSNGNLPMDNQETITTTESRSNVENKPEPQKDSEKRKEELRDHSDVTDAQLTLNSTLFSQMLSNFSNSKITVSVIIILIAALLYRRIYLL